jgi:hypothetical protein
MHAERSDPPSPALALETDRLVMLVLLTSPHSPWSRDELRREISGPDGAPAEVEGAIAELYGAGLVHVQGGLVTLTRAARLMDELCL